MTGAGLCTMAVTLICGRCGQAIAYLFGDARPLAAALDDVRVRCSDCALLSRGRRLCKCGHPLSYHTTTGETGACVWKDWPREGPIRDEPIQCKCAMYEEADPIA